ncbi:MAG: polyketide synthase dehydratase domain-containing protein, partial [Actinomycetota bacterium]|nr:polyketide synthase dehydratase domain-containing protein [Actinomycetota bacterium]
RSLTFQPPRVRVVSNVTGAVAGRELTDPEYWVGHVLAPVQFAAGIDTLIAMGFDTFVEVGPHPVLCGMAQECVPPGTGTWVPSLRRQLDDHQQLSSSLGALHLAGVPVDWRAVEAPHDARRVALPTSPFERQPYWVRRGRRATAPSSAAHPLLGSRLRSPLSTLTFESEMAADSLAILGDHRVFGTSILPATAFLEIGLAAGRALMPHAELDDVVIHEALVAPDDQIVTVQTIVTPDANGASFRIYSQHGDAGDEHWTTHVSGRIRAADPHAPRLAVVAIHEVADRAVRVVEAEEHEAVLAERGLQFGPSLRNVVRSSIAPAASGANGGEAVGELALAPREAAEAGRYV